MFSSLVAVCCVIFGIFWWLRKENNGKYKPIPGPMGLPVLGNVLQLEQALHVPFSKWAKKYGDIFKLQLGKRTAVVISEPKMLKEIFNMEFTTGRQFFEGFELYPGEPLGLTSIEGPMWHAHRLFLVRNLKDFGFGKSSMEDRIIEEVKELLDRLKEHEGRSVSDIKQKIMIAVVNSLWQIAGSKRFAQDDKDIIWMQESTVKLIDSATKYAIALFIPIFRYILPQINIDEHKKYAEKFYYDIIDEHVATLQADSPRDFIDQYLIEMEANKNNPESHFYGAKARRQLLVVLGDIIFAGTDTTSMTLQWSILLLTWHKNIQMKLQDEIKSVTGGSRLVSVKDRPNMPYTLAFIDEVLRWTSLAATGVQRRAKEGKEFKGYWIPEDAWIFANLHFIHHNPSIWGDPEEFRPERFLQDGKVFKKNENLMPFSTGKRACIGELMARDTIFLFLTNIFQRFETEFDKSKGEPTLEGKPGLFIGPPDFHVFFKDRNANQ